MAKKKFDKKTIIPQNTTKKTITQQPKPQQKGGLNLDTLKG